MHLGCQVVGPPSQTSSKTFVFDKNTVFPLFWQIRPVSFVTLFCLLLNVRWWLGWTVTTNPTGQTLRNWQITVFLGKTKGLEDFARKGHISWSLATGREDQVRHTEFFFRRVLGFSQKKFILSFLIEFLWSFDATWCVWKLLLSSFQRAYPGTSISKTRWERTGWRFLHKKFVCKSLLRCTWAGQVVGPPSQTSSKTFVFDKNTVFPLFGKSAPSVLLHFFACCENVRWWLGWTVTTNPTGQTLRNWQITVFLGKTKGLEDFARKGHISWSLATGREDQVRHTEFFFEGF